MTEIDIELLIDKNQPADKYIDMYQVWESAGYKIPFSRWVKEGLTKYSIHAHRLFVKDNPTGRPRVHYYIDPVAGAEWLGAVERRRHILFNLVGE